MTAPEKTELWTELATVEAYLTTGYRNSHPVPLFRAPEAISRGLDSLASIAQEIATCQACPLFQTRRKAVPGEGAAEPWLLVVGEGPGADEDACGRPFVGRAGQLLDKMLAAIGLDRQKNCFITNIVKCRPPGNRNPESSEELACLSFLERQIELLKPHCILSLGNVPTKRLLAKTEGITKLHGHWGSYHGIPLLPTFHPSALLRDESYKRPAWEDLKTLKAALDKERCP